MSEPAVPSWQLEHDLERARQQGRWLSDEEQQAQAEQQRLRLLALEQQQRQHRKLAILAAVCVLIPPLWPLALGLTLYLLFPRTTRRLGLVAGIAALVLGTLVAGVITAVVVAILIALF
jgi:hypothetical protein